MIRRVCGYRLTTLGWMYVGIAGCLLGFVGLLIVGSDPGAIARAFIYGALCGLVPLVILGLRR